MANLKAKEYKTFENIKQTTAEGSEFWFARELSSVLEYSEWRNFSKVIEKAMVACKNSGYATQDHFVDVNKMIEIGKGAKRKTQDYQLSRYACYLIMQNGDPRKAIIALGQTYFAIQTRRQEVAEYFNQLDEDNKRLVIRGDVRQWNKMLADAAHKATVLANFKGKHVDNYVTNASPMFGPTKLLLRAQGTNVVSNYFVKDPVSWLAAGLDIYNGDFRNVFNSRNWYSNGSSLLEAHTPIGQRNAYGFLNDNIRKVTKD